MKKQLIKIAFLATLIICTGKAFADIKTIDMGWSECLESIALTVPQVDYAYTVLNTNSVVMVNLYTDDGGLIATMTCSKPDQRLIVET